MSMFYGFRNCSTVISSGAPEAMTQMMKATWPKGVLITVL